MLKKLRAKPEHVKKRITLVFTIVIFSIIVFVWLSSWDARMHGGETREKTLSPIDSISEVFHGIAKEVKDGIAGTQTYIENSKNNMSASATSTSGFDLSGIVVLDPGASSTVSTTTATSIKN